MLYLPAVIFVAIEWGVAFAVLVSVASAVVFAAFLPPEGAPLVTESSDLLALAVYLVTALVVGHLAAGLRRHTREAADLGGEQAALRRVATGRSRTAATRYP